MTSVGFLRAPVRADAQGVRGQVRGELDRPLEGVIITLIDSVGAIQARAIAGQSGDFLLTAGRDGEFRVHAIRLGMRPFTSKPVMLRSGGTTAMTITMQALPPLLAAEHAMARSECGGATDSATAIFAAWEAAKTVLASSLLAADITNARLEIKIYRRSLDAVSPRVLEAAEMLRSGNLRKPFGATRTPASFAQDGYVDSSSDGALTFRAPDAEVLLSGEFLATHCLKLRSDSVEGGWVGIAFDPKPSIADHIDIRGTLWLDRKSAGLRRVSWRYTGLQPPLDQGGAGGQLQFTLLPTGIWAITDWWIRMPRPGVRRTQVASAGSGGRIQYAAPAIPYIESVEEVGGQVSTVSLPDGSRWTADTRPTSLRVHSRDGTPAPAGVHVRLDNTPYEGTTDGQGWASVSVLRPGIYPVSLSRGDGEGAEPVAHTELEIRTPGDSLQLASQGSDWKKLEGRRIARDPNSGTVTIAGRIVSEGRPVHAIVSAVSTGVTASADSLGRFRLRLPAGVQVLRVRAMGYSPLDTTVVSEAGRPDLSISLVRLPTMLDSVRMEASATLKPIRYANTMKFDLFFERRHAAIGGTFLTREDIERGGATDVMDLLRAVPGVSVSRNQVGDVTLRFERCESLFQTMGRLPMFIAIDGISIPDGAAVLRNLKADDLEAMEVYQGPSQLPPDARGNACGAIYVWTRYLPGKK